MSITTLLELDYIERKAAAIAIAVVVTRLKDNLEAGLHNSPVQWQYLICMLSDPIRLIQSGSVSAVLHFRTVRFP